MARNRMIRPEFWEDTNIAKLSMTARLLFIAMWNFADDEGYLKAETDWIKAKCFPYDNIKIGIYIKELETTERIVIKNGIINIKNFLKYQKINRPYPSTNKIAFTNNSLNVSEHSHTKEEVKEKEKEKEKGKGAEALTELPSFMEEWNNFTDHCLKLGYKVPKIQSLTNSRKLKLKNRLLDTNFTSALKDYKIFNAITSQPFLLGKNDRNWVLDFDWLIENDTNFMKVMEKKYLKESKNVF